MKEANSLGRKRIFFDLVLIMGLLLFALIAIVITRNVAEDGSFVRVTVNGECVAEYSLFKDGEYSLNGGTNILRIKDGKASVIHSECPDHVCENMGEISLTGERVVCLPNKLIIEIIGEGDVDFVA